MSDIKQNFIEDLVVGQSASLSKTVNEADVAGFAEITGDFNPVHVDEDYARGTIFKGRIAHGMLTAGVLSAVLGTELPGPGAIYMSQNMKFRAPVMLGDTIVASVVIEEIIMNKKQVRLSCQCHVGDTLVLDGEARLMVPRRT